MFKILFFSIWFLFHPVHVTLTSIDWTPEIECFKVFVRMYADDFLLDCKMSGYDLQNVDFSADDPFSRGILEKYVKEKLELKVNDKLLEEKLEDVKIVDNEISMNLKFLSGKRPRSIMVKNLIMTDLYTDMSNMIILRVNDFEEGVKLTSFINEKTFIIK